MLRPKSPSFSFIALKASSPGARITGTAAVRIANTPRPTANPAKPQRRDDARRKTSVECLQNRSISMDVRMRTEYARERK